MWGKLLRLTKSNSSLRPFFIWGLIFFLLFIFHSSIVNAQPIDPSKGYWVRYYNQFSLTPKWIWHNEIDERRLLNPDRQAQFFIHTHIHYLPSTKLDFAFGFNHNLSKNRTNITVPEWRPWQEVNFNATPTSKIKLSFRYRLDERFIQHSSAHQLEDGYQFVLRHRIRIQAMHRIGKNEQVTVKLSNELMLNTSPVLDTFDQNRIFGAIEFKLTKNLSLETGYLNQLIRRNGESATFHILRTTLYHRLQRRLTKL
jgi:Protein of unknown function (DUF2490)